MMTTKDKTILLFLIKKITVLNNEIKSLKEQRELLLGTVKKSIEKRQTLRLVN